MITHEEMRIRAILAIFGENEVMYGVGRIDYPNSLSDYYAAVFNSFSFDFQEAKAQCENLNIEFRPYESGAYTVFKIEKTHLLETQDFQMIFHRSGVTRIREYFQSPVTQEIEDYRSKEDQRFQDKYEEEWTSS